MFNAYTLLLRESQMEINKGDLFDFDLYQIKPFLILLSSPPTSTHIGHQIPVIPLLGHGKFDKLSVD